METLRLKQREPMPEVENWDDDDFAIGTDDLTLASNNSTNAPSRRESHSSHLSFRSELESLPGEEKHVHLPGDDEKSTLDAVAVARNAGIPIPQNVPPTALTGGTIKRLGGRKIQKAMVAEDWGDDIVLPEQGQSLRIKQQDASKFPAVLRQVSGGSTAGSPAKPASQQHTTDNEMSSPPTVRGTINLDQFKDNDDDDFFGDGMETIKVSKSRQSKPISLITPPTPQKKDNNVEDEFEADLELPSNGKLELSKKRDIPKTPHINTSDDFDWDEGSLGTRFAGTHRSGWSARSSSASALSPSVSSSITAESEDETFDGLVLPTGQVDFSQRLQRRKISRSPERIIEEPAEEEKASPKKASPQRRKIEKEDLLDGLDLGEGEVFDSRKLTLNRNIKVKNARPSSPTRPKTTVSLTFTNKVSPGASRLPRPSHERARSSLEPVIESTETTQVARNRRSMSRIGGHSAQSSISSINTPTTPSSTSSIPSTPSRRQLSQKTSQASLRNNDHQPHTTSAQLLRLKRSCPAMKAPQSPAKPMTGRYERPPSRTETSSRQSYMRPKTPVERRPKTPTERRAPESAATQTKRNPLPFLPAGGSTSQSHHITAKSSRTFRRHDSDNSLDFRPNSRAISRSAMRSPSPRRGRIVPDAPWRQQTKPARARHFGDGHELDGFDDLPTSKETEARFIRQPVNGGSKLSSLRNKHYQNILPDRNATPSPITPFTPGRSDSTPHFARDTAASRIAREASLAQRGVPGGPVAPLTTQRVAQLATRPNFNPLLPQNTIRSKKSRKPVSNKPLLISNLNSSKQSKVVNGMYYNAETFRWEGNENVLNAFEPPASSPSTTSLRIHREKENTTPRLGLITNINATKGVQVVGQMVFDPQNMCWLKMGTPTAPGGKAEPDPMDGFNALDDEEDVFKDIPDLEDNDKNENTERGGRGRLSDIQDEWPVGEEFDVGPEFIKRQREEEERWRKKCEKWATPVARDAESWRWSIREIVNLG